MFTTLKAISDMVKISEPKIKRGCELVEYGKNRVRCEGVEWGIKLRTYHIACIELLCTGVVLKKRAACR